MWKCLSGMAGFLLMLACAASASSPANAQIASIESFLDEAMPASRAPGMAYAVVENGTIRSGARGEALLGSGEAVTPDTPFLIGSISKSFTALAIMQLAEAGQISLDDPVSLHLAAFRDRPSGAITIRQLLSHTSGYSTMQGNDRHLDEAGGADELAREVERSAQTTPANAPGTVFAYSNANYRILGRVIEAVSGTDYASYINRQILEPLGMTNSFVSDGQTYPQMAAGHTPWFLTKRPFDPGVTHRVNAPAGGVIASANDLALYLAMMMNGEDDIVSAAAKEVMMRSAGEASPNYGLGWMVINAGESAYHTGTSPGVETLATMVPSQQKGAVVLVNAGSGFGIGETEALIGGTAARAFGEDYESSGGRLSRLSLFALVVVLPLFFLICMVWAWRNRAALRAKSGPAGMFSLWFPVLATAAMAWCFLYLVPALFGTPLHSLQIYLPDLVLMMIAASIAGAVWAVFRLIIAYSGARTAA